MGCFATGIFDIFISPFSRNNSATTLFSPKVPESSENENGGSNATALSGSNGNCVLNVNKSTNKINSELTTVTETAEKKSSVGLTLCNGPKKKLGGWGRLKGKTTNDSSEAVQSNTEDKVDKVVTFTETENQPKIAAPKPAFTIPKLSLSSESDTVLSCKELPEPQNVQALRSPEHLQMMDNLKEFKVQFLPR